MKLLKKLYQIFSASGKTEPMQKFIINFCKQNNLSYEIDNNNIYVTKGTGPYPCIVAHTDQVQRDPKGLVVYRNDGVLFGWSTEEMEQWGLGADDKNGIWVALKCLLRYDNIKAAFFCDEEVGCLGSSVAKMEFFDDCKYVIQADRKGYGDFINVASYTELCSQEFIDACHLDKFNYKPAIGMMTDVMTLKQKGLKVCCCNISCGYYNPHTNNEITIIDDLVNCFNFICNIIENVTEVMPHEYVYKAPSYTPFKYNSYSYKKEDYCDWCDYPEKDEDDPDLKDEMEWKKCYEQPEWSDEEWDNYYTVIDEAISYIYDMLMYDTRDICNYEPEAIADLLEKERTFSLLSREDLVLAAEEAIDQCKQEIEKL